MPRCGVSDRASPAFPQGRRLLGERRQWARDGTRWTAHQERDAGLAHLSGDRLALGMVEALTGDRNRTFPDRALMTNLARLVDRSLVRYREAVDYFSEWIATRHQGIESARFRAVSAIEEFITLTHRAVLHARRLEDRLVDPKLIPTFADCQTIEDMRDAIQHTEELLLGPA